MKRRNLLTSALVGACLLFSASALASCRYISAHYNKELWCTLNSDGESYSVHGMGGCLDTELVIPSEYKRLPVTGIATHAFYYNSSLTSVVIPDSVTRISDSAFAYCDSLTSVVISNSLTSIGYSAFAWCDSLTNVEIPDSLTSIGDSAFDCCDSLTSVVIGNSVMRIGEEAFSYCDSLTNVYYKGTAEEWDEISIGSWNENLTNATRYYYSETEASGCWRYVDGVPTIW